MPSCEVHPNPQTEEECENALSKVQLWCIKDKLVFGGPVLHWALQGVFKKV